MYKSSYVLGVALLLVLLSTCCQAYEERPDFCIETEPMLLADIKRQMVAPLQNQSKCNITATLLTPNEKVSSNNANGQFNFNELQIF